MNVKPRAGRVLALNNYPSPRQWVNAPLSLYISRIPNDKLQNTPRIDGAGVGSSPRNGKRPRRELEEPGGRGGCPPSGGECTSRPLTVLTAPVELHSCPYPGCDKAFKTKRGLGQHERHIHREERDSQMAQSLPANRAGQRWTQAERVVLVREEQRLYRENPNIQPGVMNDSLSLFSTSTGFRSVEAIKKARKTAAWIACVEEERTKNSEHLARQCPIPADLTEARVLDVAGSPSESDPNAAPSLSRRSSESAGPSDAPPDEFAKMMRQVRLELLSSFSSERGPRVTPVDDCLTLIRANLDPALLGESLQEAIRASFDAWTATLRQGETVYGRSARTSQKPEKRAQTLEQETGVHGSELPAKQKPKSERRRKRVRRSKRSAKRAGLRRQHKSSFESNPFLAAKQILNSTGSFQAEGGDQAPSGMPIEPLEAYWGEVFSAQSGEDSDNRVSPMSLLGTEQAETRWSLCRPVLAEELEQGFRDANTKSVPGPDNLTWKALRAAPRQDLLDWMNLFLLAERPASSLLQAVVTLVPKVQIPQEPGDYRPIAVASALLRIFHSIIARRWDVELQLPSEQRGFRQCVDGTFENVFILRNLIKSAKRSVRKIALCFCDIKNAFGAVSHKAVLIACQRMGVPAPMVSYVENVYKDFCIKFKGGSGRLFSVNRGVLQGDPLSSVVFNCVMALVMSSQRRQFGVGRTGNSREVNNDARITTYASYADDTILMAETRLEMQSNFAELQAALEKVGLRLNAKKCATFELDKAGKQKKTFVRSEPFLKVEKVNVPALGERDFYKYLGIKFSPEGTTGFVTPLSLQRDLARVGAARIDPQDRLFVIRSVLIPRMHHSLVLGQAHGKALRELDRFIRKAVREWLHVPHDTPLGFFHAKARDGGLGIPNLATEVPRLRADRLRRIVESPTPLIKWLMGDEAIAASVSKDCDAERLISRLGDFSTKEASRDSWRNLLVNSSIDGRGLAIARNCPQSSEWLTHPNCGISGKEFVKAVHMRGNLLRTPARAGRGGRASTSCFHCRGTTCGLGHILQRCPTSHGCRVARHDSVVGLIAASIRRSAKFQVVEGPIISKEAKELTKPEKDALIPDLVIYNRGEITIIDPTIVSDHSTMRDLETAANHKVVKYNSEVVRSWAREKFAKGRELKSFKVIGLPITWRGLWRRDDFGAIIERLRLPANLRVLLAIRTLVFGWRIWSSFSQKRT